MAKRTAVFELHQGVHTDAIWYWRLVARNGKIIAHCGEGYSSPAAAKRAINTLLKTVDAAKTIVIVEIVEED